MGIANSWLGCADSAFVALRLVLSWLAMDCVTSADVSLLCLE
jgi:hypothetical protein